LQRRDKPFEKALPKLREEYVREKKSRDEMRSKRLEEQKRWMDIKT
jgi:hypothetical protein